MRIPAIATLSILCACASSPTTKTAPVQLQAPAVAWPLHLKDGVRSGRTNLFLKQGETIALDLRNIKMADCDIQTATLSGLETHGDAFGAQLNDKGDTLLIKQKKLGGAHIRGQLTFPPPKPDIYADLASDFDKNFQDPKERRCELYTQEGATLPFDIHVMSDVPSYVSLRHPGLHNNLASGDTLYTLPNAPVDVSYEVITKLGYPWYKWSKQALANAFPSQNSSKAGSAVFRMPADGDDYTLTSSYGNAFTFQSVSYDDLQVIDVLLRQKTNQHFNIMDTSAPTRSKGDIVIQLLKLRGEHAINYLSQDLYAHLSLESRTPKVCQVDKAAKDWHAIDAQSLKIERLTSEDFGDHLPSLGTLRILGEGVCTFSTTIGGASKTRSFEILP